MIDLTTEQWCLAAELFLIWSAVVFVRGRSYGRRQMIREYYRSERRAISRNWTSRQKAKSLLSETVREK